MFFIVIAFCPVVFEMISPLWLILGQYLQRPGRLHGCVDMNVSLGVLVLVEALTN